MDALLGPARATAAFLANNGTSSAFDTLTQAIEAMIASESISCVPAMGAALASVLTIESRWDTEDSTGSTAQESTKSSVIEPSKSTFRILGNDVSEPDLTRYMMIVLIFATLTLLCRLVPELRTLVGSLEGAITLWTTSREIEKRSQATRQSDVG